MLTKTITYTDYNGRERTEDFYFNLTEKEILAMESSMDGGLSENINIIINKDNIPKMFDVFERIILDSYGEKSPDGKRFIKSKELSEEFSQTGAYDVLFMELATDGNKASDFINGIIPTKLRNQMAQENALPNNAATRRIAEMKENMELDN